MSDLYKAHSSRKRKRKKKKEKKNVQVSSKFEERARNQTSQGSHKALRQS